jgi:hypothetical protein
LMAIQVQLNVVSFLHLGFSQVTSRFDRSGRGSFRWFRGLFARRGDTALPGVRGVAAW